MDNGQGRLQERPVLGVRGTEYVADELETNGAGVGIDKEKQSEPAPKRLHEFIDAAIGHEVGIAKLPLDTAVGGVVEHHQTAELMVGGERIFDDPETV
ncbi:hypothetical protein HMPREF1981_03176 [Bacteroides pyogenes F0041]|uniref:Uncharacterized protein n=1 Tax=Bacteroides pyogenes F0041 TaxID=1321819 RepID=U2DIU2_9BACE|nr:hypothetical protein HMPREF1981_03176 [Bacteroides pyogenes F0041]